MISCAPQGSEPAIAAMGGHFTQAVDREVMTYSATVLKDDVPKAMAVLADAVKVRENHKPRYCCCICVSCLASWRLGLRLGLGPQRLLAGSERIHSTHI